MMKQIGMIVPSVDNSFFASLAHFTEKYLRKEGYSLLLCDSANGAEREKEYLKMLSEICDGILDVSGLKEFTEDLLPEGYPIVFVDRKPESAKAISAVRNDDESAMYEATSYLIAKGCKTIVLLPGYLAEGQESPRVKGYRKALEDAGMAYQADLVLNREGKKSSEEESSELIMQLMKNSVKTDAIITSSDRAAFGAIKALGRVGYYVPEDVKLISFDNSPYSLMVSPSISAIDRNPEILSQKACEILLQKIRKEAVDEQVIVPVSLIKRDSTR